MTSTKVVSILGVALFPSEILYQVEPESYRAFLAEFLDQALTTDEDI